MERGYKIIAEIEKIDGKEPKIKIRNNDFEVLKSAEGRICITYRTAEEFFPLK